MLSNPMILLIGSTHRRVRHYYHFISLWEESSAFSDSSRCIFVHSILYFETTGSIAEKLANVAPTPPTGSRKSGTSKNVAYSV